MQFSFQFVGTAGNLIVTNTCYKVNRLFVQKILAEFNRIIFHQTLAPYNQLFLRPLQLLYIRYALNLIILQHEIVRTMYRYSSRHLVNYNRVNLCFVFYTGHNLMHQV